MSSGIRVMALVLACASCGGELPLSPDGAEQDLLTSATPQVRTISGWVYETTAHGEPPVPDAIIEVRMENDARLTIASSDGFYRIEVRPGALIITASKRGYQPRATRVTVVTDTVLNFSLQPL